MDGIRVKADEVKVGDETVYGEIEKIVPFDHHPRSVIRFYLRGTNHAIEFQKWETVLVYRD